MSSLSVQQSEFRPGDVVQVIGAVGTDRGRVEAIHHVDDMPDIAGAPSAALVREFLAEMGVQRAAMISHRGGAVCFAALQDVAGRWSDLQGNPLEIVLIEKGRVQ